mgnify:CR=1 FL=1
MDQTFTRVSDFVAFYAARTPDAEAAVLGERRLSYAELHRQVEAFNAALHTILLEYRYLSAVAQGI